MGLLGAGEASEMPQLGAGDSEDVADAEVVEETPAEEGEQDEGGGKPVEG
jgi:hypothetical protein